MQIFTDISFAHKDLLWLLLIIPLLILWYVFANGKRQAAINASSLQSLKGIRLGFKNVFRHIPFAFRMMAVALMIVALARPQARSSWKDVTSEGIDIVVAMDISASMLAKDFKPDRLEASKEVAIEFIDARPNDRIGLVIFSGESFTQCPLTTDHQVLKNLFSGIKTGMIADGTAIGMGLATAVNRVKDSKATSKVVILLTDGVNNQGSVAPLTAADIAKAFGVRVYTIGLGSNGMALSPVAILPNGQYQFDYTEVRIDEESMRKISALTGGKYFRATGKEKLREVYKEIDKLEKTKFEEKSFTNKEEHFWPFALAAAALLALEFMISKLILRSIAS